MNKGESQFKAESFINPSWLIPREMTTTGFPWKKELSDKMRERIEANRSRVVPANQWMEEKLKTTGERWVPEYPWGYRIFDFWCGKKGIAIEVDGASHDNPQQRAWDYIRDEYNFRRSAILVIRVRSFNEADAELAIQQVSSALYWKQRRIALGMVGEQRTRLLLGGFNRREQKRLKKLDNKKIFQHVGFPLCT